MANKTTRHCRIFTNYFCIFTTQLALQAISLNALADQTRQNATTETTETTITSKQDLRWPNRQLNILIDQKSFNESEQLILTNLFRELERETCIKVKQLSADHVNPFKPPSTGGQEEKLNFLYIFKSPLKQHSGSLGLSSLGCLRQGRQSMVLNELAFKFPELVLKYHLMRSLGVENVERPSEQVNKLLNVLPLSQRIYSATGKRQAAEGDAGQASFLSQFLSPISAQADKSNNPLAAAQNDDSFYVFSSNNKDENELDAKYSNYLNSDDANTIKRLYECTDLQARLWSGPAQALLLDGRKVPIPTLRIDQEETSKKPAEGSSNASRDYKSIATNEHKTTRLDNNNNNNKSSPSFVNEQATKETTTKSQLIDESAKQIVNYLLADEQQQKPKQSKRLDEKQQEFDKLNSLFESSQNECEPMQSCPLGRRPISASFQDNSTESFRQRPEVAPSEAPFDAHGNSLAHERHLHERPMILKLDEFNAQDPHLKQANQMKLIQQQQQQRPANTNETNLGLMNQADLPGLGNPFFWQSEAKKPEASSNKKHEMLISFEQTPAMDLDANPLAAVASSQVLKLCSCTCQTMTPSSGKPDQTTGSSTGLPQPTFEDTKPTFAYSKTPATPNPTTEDPSWTSTEPPSSEIPVIPTTTRPPYFTAFPNYTLPPQTDWTTDDDQYNQTTTISPPVSTLETTTQEYEEIRTTSSSSEEASTSSTKANNQLVAANACNQVEWTHPNKSLYESERIVWDMDRGNQNYFLCRSEIGGELVPGKTHGLSCKLSQEGKAYETHSFSVLTKPKNVSLAWVKNNSNSFGRQNLPVVGGLSKQHDPYIVARCLVKDENNDTIMLIGYVNNQGIGWFPFDDVQIECDTYDVLACLN